MINFLKKKVDTGAGRSAFSAVPATEKNSVSSADPDIQITVRSKEKLLFSGLCKTVSSENQNGPFDILYRHANFISLIFHYVILDRGLSTETAFQMEKGIMYVYSGKVEIYVGI